MKSTPTRRRSPFVRGLTAFGALAVALVTTSCGSEVLFIGDPAFESTLADTGAFETAIRDAARSVSLRSEVYWPEETLNAIALEPILQDFDAPTIALSPYLSLLVAEVVPTSPDRRFVGYYGSEPLPNLTWVALDALPAMTEAGAALARWVFDTPGRTAVMFVDESDRSIREEARALGSAFEQEAGVELRRESFSDRPSRDDVRSRVQAIGGTGERAVVLLLGTATGWALEQLRDEQTVIGLRHAMVSEQANRILFSVRDDLALGLESALRDGGTRVVVPSVLDLSPVHFPGRRRN